MTWVALLSYEVYLSMDVPYGSNTRKVLFKSLDASYIVCSIQGTKDSEMSHSQSLYSVSSKSSGTDRHIAENFRQYGLQSKHMI